MGLRRGPQLPGPISLRAGVEVDADVLALGDFLQHPGHACGGSDLEEIAAGGDFLLESTQQERQVSVSLQCVAIRTARTQSPSRSGSERRDLLFADRTRSSLARQSRSLVEER